MNEENIICDKNIQSIHRNFANDMALFCNSVSEQVRTTGMAV